MKTRIWELDAFRGLCILGMVVVHFVYDLVELFAVVPWEYPAAFSMILQWGGVLFLILSGICVTLGSHPVRRGLTVFACGMICTAVTAGMYRFGYAGKSILIYFGVLHCLGVCMLLWWVFQRLPWQWLTGLGLILAAVGLWLRGQTPVDFPWLIPFGILCPGFSSSDFFPLLPNLGFFLLGAAAGKTLYASRVTLFPRVRAQTAAVRSLSFCGRHSLWIYLLHQPVLTALIWAAIRLVSFR